MYVTICLIIFLEYAKMRYGRINGDIRTIPFTFGRYTASITGNVYDNYLHELVKPTKDGNITIKMDGGTSITRNIIWFILLAFKPIHLPLTKVLHFNFTINPKYAPSSSNTSTLFNSW